MPISLDERTDPMSKLIEYQDQYDVPEDEEEASERALLEQMFRYCRPHLSEGHLKDERLAWSRTRAGSQLRTCGGLNGVFVRRTYSGLSWNMEDISKRRG